MKVSEPKVTPAPTTTCPPVPTEAKVMASPSPKVSAAAVESLVKLPPPTLQVAPLSPDQVRDLARRVMATE